MILMKKQKRILPEVLRCGVNKYCFVIPVYRHGSTLEHVVSSLEKYGFPIIVVDDGNGDEDRKFILAVREKHENVILVERKKNGGKGKAMNDGMKMAYSLGFTHALQIDSDGQHDVGAVEKFVELSEKNPDDVIAGYPEYDESVPVKRLKGRKIANFWIRVVTLSGSIVDAMIGFRVYPVKSYNKVMAHSFIDSHMGFDIDILVHLVWAGAKVISSPVNVFYPKDGVSNFRMFRDNVHISLTYARLCCALIIIWPVLLVRKMLKGKR